MSRSDCLIPAHLHTDVALPEVICLALSGLVTREFPINFIPDVGHCDEGGHNSGPATSFDCKDDADEVRQSVKIRRV